MTPSPAAPDLAAASDVVDLADQAVGTAIRQLTASGGPDVHQVLAYDLAHAASAVATAKALLDYGAKGDVEARITCAFVADVVHDLASKLIGREQLWGVDPASLSPAHDFVVAYRDPDFVGSLADQAGPRHLSDDMEMVQDTFRAFANNVVAPHAEHVHRTNGDVPGGDHHRARRDRRVRPERARRLRRLQRGRRRRVHRDGRRDRGAEPGQPRHRRLAHHPPRDPHPRPREGRHRGPEARMAPEARHRRGDAGRRRHRARLRQRRGRHQGHGHTRRRSRRRARLRHQRRQDVVHARGTCRRPGAPGPHRSRSLGHPPRPEPVHRPQAPRRRARVRVQPGRRRAHGRDARSTPSVIGACTRTRSRSRTGGCRPRT